jgi:hypothetical protein
VARTRFGCSLKKRKTDLKRWLTNKSVVPVAEEIAFALNQESGARTMFAPVSNLHDENDDDEDDDGDDESTSSLYFRFIVTSKLLLRQAINVEHVCTDATYKLIWLGFPVFRLIGPG